jgi:hypothetical protein
MRYTWLVIDFVRCSECYPWGSVHCDAERTAGGGLELHLAPNQETQAVTPSLFTQDSGLINKTITMPCRELLSNLGDDATRQPSYVLCSIHKLYALRHLGKTVITPQSSGHLFPTAHQFGTK